MYKDKIYLIGAIEILKNRKKINFLEFHSGKFSLEDYFILSQNKLIYILN